MERISNLMQKTVWILVGLWVVVSGCGYRFVGGGSFPGGIQNVFVEILENKTADVGIENTFTNDLIYEITRTGAVKLTSENKAQGVLTGSITRISNETVSRRDQKEAAERRLTVYVDLQLKATDGRVVWSGNSIAANETYPVDPLKEQTEKNKSDAFEALSRRLAEVINNRLTSDF
jgi:outer membrane lipopolysaccharide assembly protein LptE/RlpB